MAAPRREGPHLFGTLLGTQSILIADYILHSLWFSVDPQFKEKKTLLCPPILYVLYVWDNYFFGILYSIKNLSTITTPLFVCQCAMHRPASNDYEIGLNIDFCLVHIVLRNKFVFFFYFFKSQKKIISLFVCNLLTTPHVFGNNV